MLLPMLALAGCGSGNRDQEMAEKLAAAEAAAEKAIAAQQAAERAAAIAASIRPPSPPAPIVVSDFSSGNDMSGDNGDGDHDSNDDPLLTGGEG